MQNTRPTQITPTLALNICTHISAGKTLTEICAPETMPEPISVYRWIHEHSEFAEAYKQALGVRGHRRFDKLDGIVNDLLDGSVPPKVGKTAADIIKWMCTKDNFEAYGEKSTTQHTGAAGQPLEVVMRGILGEIAPTQDVKLLTQPEYPTVDDDTEVCALLGVPPEAHAQQ